ncbi:MAG: hypothetical protein GX929_08555 [Clostridiales bacterium]|nr:hypothetical protein [Clostridiales bacterium]
MSKFIPWPAYYDDAPIDLRFVYDGAPAGKHGFVKADGDIFTFSDGTPARFWGTNFNGAANFPSHDYAEKVARRLAKIGCNIVRFHQLDSEWHTPNIFAFTKGKRLSATMELDPESMDRLDYLIYSLKREGIYVYMDIFTYRKFKADDGVENTIALGDAAKPYSSYNRRLIELQKKFAYDFWTHLNPYTGMAHKDDPVFAMGEIVNESDLFSRKIEVEPYASEFRSLYDKWLKTKGLTDDAFSCDLSANIPSLIEFKIYLQEKYYDEMIGFLREIGVKIPLCGTNWAMCGANVKTQMRGDFTDGHTYFYDWQWGKHNCMNRRQTEVAEPATAGLMRARVAGMPYFVSEWDMPWPNEFRAESSLLYAAVGSLQGWGGYAIHTYAYTPYLDRMDTLGKEVSSGAIGGVAYREGIFSTWNDPAKFGLFYHAALIQRRSDVRMSDGNLKINERDLGMGAPMDAYRTIAEQTKAGACFDGSGTVEQDTRIIPEDAGEVRSDTGELYRSWDKGYGVIDTDRTQAVYGLLEKQGKIEMKALSVESKTDFAVVALSSLTDMPISESDNMLLTTVGRAKNTGAKFTGEHMDEYGEAPILAEVIEATLTIKTARRDLRVWAVNAEGFYHGVVPVTYTDDGMTFTLGEQFPSVYYLISAE